MLDHAVEAVIDHRFVSSVTVVDLKLVAQSATCGPKSHMVDDGCCTATRGGAGTGKKIITATGDADINIEMGMHVDTARHDVASFRVDGFTG